MIHLKSGSVKSFAASCCHRKGISKLQIDLFHKKRIIVECSRCGAWLDFPTAKKFKTKVFICTEKGLVPADSFNEKKG